MGMQGAPLGSMFLATLAAGCAAAPRGLRATPDGTGPVVRVDWDAQPLPGGGSGCP